MQNSIVQRSDDKMPQRNSNKMLCDVTEWLSFDYCKNHLTKSIYLLVEVVRFLKPYLFDLYISLKCSIDRQFTMGQIYKIFNNKYCEIEALRQWIVQCAFWLTFSVDSLTDEQSVDTVSLTEAQPTPTYSISHRLCSMRCDDSWRFAEKAARFECFWYEKIVWELKIFFRKWLIELTTLRINHEFDQ